MAFVISEDRTMARNGHTTGCAVGGEKENHIRYTYMYAYKVD